MAARRNGRRVGEKEKSLGETINGLFLEGEG
jgi:hypothetical protein